ncbi:MAG: L-erythro-3,5-diaminohexanoate dehydrogenase [Deltaproteobacteria bacterium]|nr:L-erythro-3,5-diaminohexanoate dehydrogenase [Deltaproteobacteria bacterium]
MGDLRSGDNLGLHRVLDTPKVIPQNAKQLDAKSSLYDNELCAQVHFLQIDSASFNQLAKAYPDDSDLKAAVMSIVNERGKMQNPVTGSGGMFLGQIAEIGPKFPNKDIQIGDEICSLISLTATPLLLEEIESVDRKKERLAVRAKAYLFANSIFAKMPQGISRGAALASFDVCGAPALALHHANAGQVVFLMGLGKAGRQVASALRNRFGKDINLFGCDASQNAVDDFNQEFESGHFFTANAQDPIALRQALVSRAQDLADLSINCVNVPDTEMPSILCTKDQGCCVFFSMATDFQKATLGVESVGKDINLIMGRGYVPGHSDLVVTLLKKDPWLLNFFENNFGGE